MSSETLDLFGRILMQEVRDESIVDWDSIIGGNMRSDRARAIRGHIAHWTPDQIDLLMSLIPQVVDSTIFNLLRMLDELDAVDVIVDTGRGVMQSLKAASDGLAGEQTVWTPRHSRQRYVSPV